MDQIGKWVTRPHRWILVACIYMFVKAGLACLEVDVSEEAITVFKVSRDGMMAAALIIGGLAKAPDMLKAATGKPTKK